MTDGELIDAIRKIVRSRPRLKGVDVRSVEAADLARYDQIVGLISRHKPRVARGEKTTMVQA
jgi:hypothetical protein